MILFFAGFPGWGPNASFGGMNAGFGGAGGRGENLLYLLLSFCNNFHM